MARWMQSQGLACGLTRRKVMRGLKIGALLLAVVMLVGLWVALW
jgi:hypothetical protein